MTDTEQIHNLLIQNNITIAEKIIVDPSLPQTYFVPLHLKRREGGRKEPSGLVLSNVRADLLKLGYRVEFILIDNETRDLEESLRASLLSSFPDDVRNSFFSQSGAPPQAWIEFKRTPETTTTDRLQEHLQKFAEIFSLPSLSMARIGEVETVTRLELLSVVRQLSPIDLPTLTNELVAQGYAVPSQDWVNRRLDALRKGNFVLRLSNGTYVLTAEALARLGTRKGRRSPDVRRILALARRGF